MRGINPLKFVPLGKGDMERYDKLEPWLRYWWGDTFTAMENPYWFEEEKIGDNLLWDPSPSAMETALYLLLGARLKQPHKPHMVVVPCLMNFLWRGHI